MKSKKKTEMRKGLSDDKLNKKYKSGKLPMRKIMKSLLTTPRPEDQPKSKKR